MKKVPREQSTDLGEQQLKQKLVNQTIEQNESSADTRSSLMNHNPNQKNQSRKAKQVGKTYRRLFRYSWGHKGLFIVANLGLIISSGGTVLLPLLCGRMIDVIKQGGELGPSAIQFIILTAVLAVSSAIRGYSFMVLGEQVMLSMRQQLFQKLVEKDIEYFDQNKTGDLLSRLGSDIATVYSASSDNLSQLLRNFLQFIGSLVFLWIISWELTLLILLLTPIVTFVVLFVIKQMKKYQKEYSNGLAFANSLATEVFGNIRVVRSFSREQAESSNYQALLEKTFGIGRKKHFFYGVMLLVTTIFANVLILSILFFGGKLTIQGELSIGDLTSFVLYTITLTVGFASISGVLNQTISAIGICEHLFQIMDHPIKVQSGTANTTLSHSKIDLIRFKNASFAYPSKPEVTVLKDLNLTIKQGESVALVGPSGSGKSSIVNLILRFYDITDGQLFIAGRNIRELNLADLRRQIGFVSQEPTLFSGSLRQNVQYGLEAREKTEERVLKALEVANAKQFVLNADMFPEGLATLVGERGVKLSGGQKQRIAIARCVAKNPSLLIFDQATSALDAQSEYVVQKAIDNLVGARDRTMVIVAHRLSTIINCDRIVVLKDGRVAEEGTHRELLELGGIYAGLVHKQMSST